MMKRTALFRDLFVNRDDLYGLQRWNGERVYYVVLEKKLSDEIVLSHFRGRQALAVYPGADSRTKWLAIDIDSLEQERVQDVLGRADKLDLPVYLESSGKKGFHVWVFFAEAVESRRARELGHYLAGGEEVFPKQDRTTLDHPGNLIKAPLGIHQETGKRCLFLDKEFRVITDQFRFLRSVEKVPPKLLPEVSVPKPTSRRRFTLVLKPCVASVMAEGVCEGVRNRTAHIIATELQKVGKKMEEVRGCLFAWNLRNEPPLSERELEAVVRNVSSHPEYDYGCHPQGALREVLGCLGMDSCWYYKQAR